MIIKFFVVIFNVFIMRNIYYAKLFNFHPKILFHRNVLISKFNLHFNIKSFA